MQLALLHRAPAAQLERFAAEHSGSRDATLAVARRYLIENRPADSVRLLEPWSQRHPADADARVVLARALMGAGRNPEAYAHLQTVLSVIDPKHPEARRWLGELLELRGEFDAAVTQYEQAVREHPRDLESALRLAELFRGSGRLTPAEQHYRSVVKGDPRNPAALTGLAEVLFRRGRADEALAYGRKAVAAAPNEGRAHLWLARSLQSTGAAAESEAEYRKALELSDSGEPRYHLATLMREQGRTSDAAATLEENVRANPLHKSSWYELAMCRRRLGQPAQAEAATRRFEQLQRADTASADLEARLSVEPMNVQLRLELAAVYVRSGRPDLARPQVQRLLKQQPDLPAARRLEAQIAAHPEPTL